MAIRLIYFINIPVILKKASSLFLIFIGIILTGMVYASVIPSHQDPIAPVILGVTVILFFALLGRYVARMLGQPSVLGELLMGVALGNIGYFMGLDFIEILRIGPVLFNITEQTLSGVSVIEATNNLLDFKTAEDVVTIMKSTNGPALFQVAHAVDVFSRYGVIFLLFLVGLETSVKELREVGGDSLRVALIGVIVPFILGFLVIWWLMPQLSLNVDLFVAATLGATSIGISARVLKELNLIKSREARIIIGAAVFDDILGLVILAVITGIIISGGVEFTNILSILLLSSLFLILAFGMGPYFLKMTIHMVERLDVAEAKMFIAFIFVMALAWLASSVGLATIIGAFAAGVILNDGYFHQWGTKGQSTNIKDLIAPLETILVPIFFVLMGIQVKLETFLESQVVYIAAGLLIAAVIGKLVSGLGVLTKSNRWAVGLGMLPRGEVGLIFAAIGKSLGVINDALFAAIVLMVIVTTFLAPPLLRWTLLRHPLLNNNDKL